MRIMTDYTATRKIASYEVNLFGELRLSTVLRICQEVAEEHLTMYQMDHVTLMKTQNLAFLILRVGMNINRLPKDGETITVLTRPEGNSGAQFYRSYKIQKKTTGSPGRRECQICQSNFIRQYKCRYASTAEGALKANGSSASSWKVTYSQASCFARTACSSLLFSA